jgi:hypothetical protein
MLLAASAAKATVYNFTFESFDSKLTATGQITVNAADEVTSISGLISGLVDQTISSVVPNPDLSGPAYSPDGSFIYNNLYYPPGRAFDFDGVLFATAQNPGGFWNLWGNPPASNRFGNRPALTITRFRRAEQSASPQCRNCNLGDARTGFRWPRRRRQQPRAANPG